jgi:hypothetical protein
MRPQRSIAVAIARDISLEGDAFAARLRGQHCGLLGRDKVAVDSKDLRSFLREAQHCRATIADPLAGALPGTDDDRDLPRKAHHACPVQAPPNSKTTGSRRYYGITNDQSVCPEPP